MNTVNNTRIDISHALDNDGTTVEAGKRRVFDYTLVSNTPTTWDATTGDATACYKAPRLDRYVIRDLGGGISRTPRCRSNIHAVLI